MADLTDVKAIAIWLLSLVMGLLTWIGGRHIRRLDDLEARMATKMELKEALDQMREDRSVHHTENRDKLDRIEEKIDANELRASNSRHETLNVVHSLALKIATLPHKRGDEK